MAGGVSCSGGDSTSALISMTASGRHTCTTYRWELQAKGMWLIQTRLHKLPHAMDPCFKAFKLQLRAVVLLSNKAKEAQ